MRQMIVFKIRDKHFDYEQYGLEDIYFALDMTRTIQSSKQVNTTEYALLDGTTRIDNISAVPGTVNFQGMLGDLNYSTNPSLNVKNYQNRNRLQNQMLLLEDLRDNAIILDLITSEKTYKNYILTAVNIGKTNQGAVDANLSFREVLLFGDEIDITSNKDSYDVEDIVISNAIEDFTIKDVNNDFELIEEVYRMLTDSSITAEYTIRLGGAEMYPDLTIPPIRYERPFVRNDFDSKEITIENNPARIERRYTAKEYITGLVRGNLYIHISIPDINIGRMTNTIGPNIIKYPLDTVISRNPVFKEEGRYSIKIQLMKKGLGKEDEALFIVNTKDLLVSPKYSNISSDVINPLVDSSNNSFDYINNNGMLRGYKAGFSFIKKNRYNIYTMAPNLLRDFSMGYLYPSFYETTKGNEHFINIGFVYLHPRILDPIKDKMTEVLNRSSYFKDKKFIWWK